MICILTRYCDVKTADGWNIRGFNIKEDTIRCKDEDKKPDDEMNNARKQRDEKKDQFAEDNGLEFIEKGSICEKLGKNLGVFDDAKLC